jgi:hypothetical protein
LLDLERWAYMKAIPPSQRLHTRPLSGLALFISLAVCCPGARAENLDDVNSWHLWEVAIGGSSVTPGETTPRVPHLRLFRFAPAFLSDPIGLQEDDSGIPGVPTTPSLPADDSGPDWIQIALGNDTPYYDLRQPGDPGGLGFYRLNTQVQVVNSPSTACTLGLQAVTPAGVQYAGLPDGPTVVSPAFSVFHALDDTTALQGFVGKNVTLSSANSHRPLQRNVQCGLALQRPVSPDAPGGWRNLFFSLGALGQAHPDRDDLRWVPNLNVLPGLHWHVNDNCWLSSGMLVPVGPAHTTAPGQWQLTCSFQF